MPVTIRKDFILKPPHGRATRADARYVTSTNAKPLVIFIHGFKGFKEWGYFNVLADYFAQQGFVFIKLNLSHNGSTLNQDEPTDLEAFGRNNFSLELADIKALIDLLYSDNCPVPKAGINLKQLYVIGHSRGGGLALLATAADTRIKATATWAGLSNLESRYPTKTLALWQKEGVLYIENSRTKQQMPLYYQLVEDFLANKPKLDIPTAVARLTQPILLIHGTHDETLPVQMAYELKSFQPNAQLEIIPEANHTFGGSHPYAATELPPTAQIAVNKTISFFRNN